MALLLVAFGQIYQSINVQDVLDLLAFFFFFWWVLICSFSHHFLFVFVFLENSFGLVSYAFFLFIFILLKCPSIHNFFKKYIMCYFLFY